MWKKKKYPEKKKRQGRHIGKLVENHLQDVKRIGKRTRVQSSFQDLIPSPRKGLERWLNNQDCLVLFLKTQVQLLPIISWPMTAVTPTLRI